MSDSTTPVIMHINYCEQGQSLPDAIAKAARWGFDGIELRGRCRQGTPQKEYIQGAIEALKASGLKVPVVALSYRVDLEDTAAKARELEETLMSVKMLGEAFPGMLFNAFSSPVLNPSNAAEPTQYEYHGSAIATDKVFQANVEYYQAVADAVKAFDGTIAFETHGFYLHDTIAASVRLVESIGRDNVGINLDLANQYYFPKAPAIDDCLQGIKQHLKYVHLKNHFIAGGVRKPIPCSLADGVINNRILLNACWQAGYKGPVCIESPRPGDREFFAREDLAYVRSLLEERSVKL